MQHFHVENLARAKRIDKRLRALLSETGVEVSLPACQNAVARMYGFAHYHELVANQGRHEPSLSDEEAGPVIADERRARHIDVLRRFGISEPACAGIVDELAPTAKHVTTAVSGKRTSIFTFDRPDMGGAAFSWRDDDGSYHASVIAVTSQGELVCRNAKHPQVIDDAGVNSVLEASPYPSSTPDLLLGMLGYRQHHKRAFWATEESAHLPVDQLRRARASIEARLDQAVMKAVFGADGMMTGLEEFNYFREAGIEGERRRAFALRYPSLAFQAVKFMKDKEMPHDPDQAAVHHRVDDRPLEPRSRSRSTTAPSASELGLRLR
ncbi:MULTISPECIES: hypothetical protein [unclassified Bradyrhizobium]